MKTRAQKQREALERRQRDFTRWQSELDALQRKRADGFDVNEGDVKELAGKVSRAYHDVQALKLSLGVLN